MAGGRDGREDVRRTDTQVPLAQTGVVKDDSCESPRGRIELGTNP